MGRVFGFGWGDGDGRGEAGVECMAGEQAAPRAAKRMALQLDRAGQEEPGQKHL